MSNELKTPWMVKQYGVCDAEEKPLAIVDEHISAAIVHRVNCHDKLVEALDRLMLQVINSGGRIHTSDCYVQSFGTCTCGAHGIYQDAKAALELAKGGGHD